MKLNFHKEELLQNYELFADHSGQLYFWNFLKLLYQFWYKFFFDHGIISYDYSNDTLFYVILPIVWQTTPVTIHFTTFTRV